MALTLRGERAQERRRNETIDEITYERTFVVATDNDRIEARAVSYCAGLPRLGDAYVSDAITDSLVRVVSKEAVATDNRQLWQVIVRYSSKHDGQDPDNPTQQSAEDDIELEPPVITFGHTARTVAITGDIYLIDGEGNQTLNPPGGFANSAGDPFEPPPEEEIFRQVLTITRNEINIDPQQMRDFINATNQNEFLGAAAQTVRIAAIDAQKLYDKNVRYWRVTYVFEFDPKGWNISLLDIGPNYKDGADIVPFLTDSVPAQRRLGLLNGSGGALAAAGTPVYRTFRRREFVDFAALNIEATLLS